LCRAEKRSVFRQPRAARHHQRNGKTG